VAGDTATQQLRRVKLISSGYIKQGGGDVTLRLKQLLFHSDAVRLRNGFFCGGRGHPSVSHILPRYDHTHHAQSLDEVNQCSNKNDYEI